MPCNTIQSRGASILLVLCTLSGITETSDLGAQGAVPTAGVCVVVEEAAAWWSFDVEGHPEAAVGTRGVVASPTGAPEVVKGRVGMGLELNEPRDGIALESGGFSVSGDVTIETWLRTERATGLAHLIVWPTEDGSTFVFGLEEGRPFFGLTGQETIAWTGDAHLSDGRWHHVGVVVAHGDSLVVKVFVDGDVVSPIMAPRAETVEEMTPRIGGNGDRAFHGVLDEIAVYSRALKRTEIVAVWAAGEAGKCPVDSHSGTSTTSPGRSRPSDAPDTGSPRG